MKNIFRLGLIIFGAALLFAACKKTDSLPFYASGIAPVITSDVLTFAPAPGDSDNIVLTLSWSSPKYAADSASAKYIVQIDSAGKDFSNAVSRTVTGTLSTSFIAKDFNAILLGFGFSFGVTYSVDIRVVSSYANNNDQKVSNPITIQVTPYVVPAKVLPPQQGTLYLVGSATAGSWGNPVPVPAQKFTRIDSLTYEGTFYLKGGNEYLMLPVNGDWTHKYAVADKLVAGLNAGGDFGYDFNDNFPAPAASGMYKIWVDFQHGVFTVTPVNVFAQIYTPGGYQQPTQWDPPSAPALASPNKDGNYEGYVNVPSGNYEFKITSDPDWLHTIYGDGGSGSLSTSGGNINFPGAGFYKINVDLNSNTYTLTNTTWGIIGSFSGSSWGSDVDMTSSTDNGNTTWNATITIVDNDQFKFRANHDWGLNYGDDDGTGKLVTNGGNIGDAGKNFSLSAGTYNITLYLNNAGFYTYKMIKQ